MILDIFSRDLLGWMLALREWTELAQQLIGETIAKQHIAPGTLTVHADPGRSMRSKTAAQLLIALDVARTHSRPHVSDDNPYSESQFKTLKYRADFPCASVRLRMSALTVSASSIGTTMSTVTVASV